MQGAICQYIQFERMTARDFVGAAYFWKFEKYMPPEALVNDAALLNEQEGDSTSLPQYLVDFFAFCMKNVGKK